MFICVPKWTCLYTYLNDLLPYLGYNMTYEPTVHIRDLWQLVYLTNSVSRPPSAASKKSESKEEDAAERPSSAKPSSRPQSAAKSPAGMPNFCFLHYHVKVCNKDH